MKFCSSGTLAFARVKMSDSEKRVNKLRTRPTFPP